MSKRDEHSYLTLESSKHLKWLISLLICSFFLSCWENWPLPVTNNFWSRNLCVQSFLYKKWPSIKNFHQARSRVRLKKFWSKLARRLASNRVEFFSALIVLPGQREIRTTGISFSTYYTYMTVSGKAPNRNFAVLKTISLPFLVKYIKIECWLILLNFISNKSQVYNPILYILYSFDFS